MKEGKGRGGEEGKEIRVSRNEGRKERKGKERKRKERKKRK